MCAIVHRRFLIFSYNLIVGNTQSSSGDFCHWQSVRFTSKYCMHYVNMTHRERFDYALTIARRPASSSHPGPGPDPQYPASVTSCRRPTRAAPTYTELATAIISTVFCGVRESTKIISLWKYIRESHINKLRVKGRTAFKNTERKKRKHSISRTIVLCRKTRFLFRVNHKIHRQR